VSWRPLRWWLLGLAAYGVFLAVNLPAAYLAPWLGRHLTGVQLAEMSGTIFAGHTAELRVQNQPLGTLAWRFDWLAPFTASYGYRFDLENGKLSLQGRADARLGTVFLRDLTGHVPVATLDHWLPLPSHSVDGILQIDLHSLVLKNEKPTAADGDIQLQDGILSWPSPFPLGSYLLALSPAGGGISGQVTDIASPLKLHCDLSLSPEGRYHVKGTFAARDPGDAATQKFLAYLGSADTSGHYPFDFSGQW
jgi:hypothetical protein